MEAFADNAQPRRPGRILAAERERQGLAPSDIAQRLRMSAWQIEALEADDYSRLPTGTFLRGFVRNYAKTLGLPPDDVLSLLAEGAPREPAPRIIVPSQNIRFDPLADRMTSPYVRAAAIAGVAIALGFAAMYWWLFVRNAPMNAARKPTPEAGPPGPSAGVAPAPGGAQSLAARPPPPPIAEPLKPPAEPAKAIVAIPEPKAIAAKPEPAKPEPAKPELAKAEPPKPTPSVQRVAATESGGTLKLRFKGKSWVEIRDAGGKVLLTGLNDPGSETEVSGRPPFRVVVGNASDVRLFFNDREFDLAPHMREAVARATVE